MTKLYVANGMNHHLDLNRAETVAIGRQNLVGDFSAEEISAIVEQNAKYGMMADKDVLSNLGRFIPYIYSLDTPIDDAVVIALLENNYDGNFGMNAVIDNIKVNGSYDKLTPSPSRDLF
jgi:hypothetical protein